jgi:hypothetical protein
MMKNIFLITILLISAMGMNSCKDKCPEPDLNQKRIERYFGTWGSLDSFTGPNPDGGFTYFRDTLMLARTSVKVGVVENTLKWRSEARTFLIQSVDNDGNALLIGAGPSHLSFGREYETHFSINETMDTLTIKDYSKLSLRSSFNNVFYRLRYL